MKKFFLWAWIIIRCIWIIFAIGMLITCIQDILATLTFKNWFENGLICLLVASPIVFIGAILNLFNSFTEFDNGFGGWAIGIVMAILLILGGPVILGIYILIVFANVIRHIKLTREM